MIKNNYPRILIYGQPFNNFSGGGITLTNLFKGWPKDKIAVAFIGHHRLFNIATDVCDTYYQIGKEEHKWIFPLNLVQRTFPSGQVSFDPKYTLTINKRSRRIRSFIVDKIFFPFLHWIGIYHCISKISISPRLKEWLSIFHPEILYLQVSTLETINFAFQLCDYLKIPSAIHMMDDWPSTISSKGLLKEYWRKRIDNEFKELLDQVDIHLSISSAMASEYKRRYNKEFKAFHNPIEIEVWQPYCKTNFNFNQGDIKILYSGRIGPGITESLIEVASAIDSIKINGMEIKLYIQSPSGDYKIINRLQRHKCVVINPIVDYSKLPIIFSKADLLLIANDFNKQGIDYLKYSMPTKISEYLISGTPVLVYAPGETAVSRFVSENECGYCVTDQRTESITDAIHFLISNDEFRKQLSHNAVRIAKELFDAKKVRFFFKKLLITIPKRESHVHE